MSESCTVTFDILNGWDRKAIKSDWGKEKESNVSVGFEVCEAAFWISKICFPYLKMMNGSETMTAIICVTKHKDKQFT